MCTLLRRPVSRVSAAPPCRPSRRRCSAPTCTATRAVADFALGSSGKVTKSAISKLAVAELRAECQRLGLPDDGLKAALVERVFSWLQQQGSQQQAQQQLQTSSVRQQSAANAVIDSAAASASRSTATALPGNVVSTPAPAAMAAQATAAVPAASSPVAMTRAPGAIGASDSSNGSSSLLQPGQQSKHSSNVRVTWLGTSSGSPTARRNVSAIAGEQGRSRWPGRQPEAAGGAGRPGKSGVCYDMLLPAPLWCLLPPHHCAPQSPALLSFLQPAR